MTIFQARRRLLSVKFSTIFSSLIFRKFSAVADEVSQHLYMRDDYKLKCVKTEYFENIRQYIRRPYYYSIQNIYIFK